MSDTGVLENYVQHHGLPAIAFFFLTSYLFSLK